MIQREFWERLSVFSFCIQERQESVPPTPTQPLIAGRERGGVGRVSGGSVTNTTLHYTTTH